MTINVFKGQVVLEVAEVLNETRSVSEGLGLGNWSLADASVPCHRRCNRLLAGRRSPHDIAGGGGRLLADYFAQQPAAKTDGCPCGTTQ